MSKVTVNGREIVEHGCGAFLLTSLVTTAVLCARYAIVGDVPPADRVFALVVAVTIALWIVSIISYTRHLVLEKRKADKGAKP